MACHGRIGSITRWWPMSLNCSYDFVDALKKGSAFEVNIEEGWWEVEPVSREAQLFVESKRYCAARRAD